MDESDYERWLSDHVPTYTNDLVQHGGWDPEAAARKAERDMKLFLPEGLQTPKQHLFIVEDEAAGNVGTLWMGELDRGDGPIAFVYDILIDPEHRGRGLGRGAMQLAEGEARRLGYAKIELNVFGGNDVARRLYRSLGYTEQAVSMGKRLT
jgi:ribosomal protein S18 acetylase RimI-like enzyme